jgi:sterol desaturase/sphingolipid hydroxylase (fatty acid hydroxylase superfamily)
VELFKDSLLVLVAAPVVLVLIAVEAVVSYLHGRHDYTVKGTLTNAYLAAVNVGLDVSMRAAWLAVMSWSFRFHFARVADPWAYWVALLVLQDFLFYFLHRVDHGCRLFWAVHLTHHSSPEFNLTVGFRPSVLQPLYRFALFAPLTLLGFRPEDVMLMYSATQLYGVLVHTRAVGKLGPLEWFLCTPSHHRVHHGTNPQYLDKNLGTVFIVWDRLFGTFAEETEEARFGLAGGHPTCHPLRVIFHEWLSLWHDLRQPVPLKAKLMYLFGPPGWRYVPRAGGPARSNEGAAVSHVPTRSVQ